MTLVAAAIAGLLAVYRGANVSWGWFALAAGGIVASTGIFSFDLVGSTGVRAWFGNFNAFPILVGSGNTFQVTGGAGAAAGIQISLT